MFREPESCELWLQKKLVDECGDLEKSEQKQQSAVC